MRFIESRFAERACHGRGGRREEKGPAELSPAERVRHGCRTPDFRAQQDAKRRKASPGVLSEAGKPSLELTSAGSDPERRSQATSTAKRRAPWMARVILVSQPFFLSPAAICQMLHIGNNIYFCSIFTMNSCIFAKICAIKTAGADELRLSITLNYLHSRRNR